MIRLPGRLGTLTARDVMTTEVITISESETLAEAINTLKRNHISGAPVIGAEGQLVGILSAADLVRPVNSAIEETSPVAWGHPEGDDAVAQLFANVDKLDNDSGQSLVRDRMTRFVVSVGERTLVVDVARTMCDGHWHRLPVVDSQGVLCGIISTMDVLAAVVNVADEAQ